MADEQKDLRREVSDIVERRDQSRQFMRSNYYAEWTDVFQAIKCRTSPIMKMNGAGELVEDKSRTNVAMPDMSIIFRRNVARMTASPYRLRYMGGDPMIANMLSALAIQQFDRTGEKQVDRLTTMSAEALGVGYSKVYWDELSPTRVFRKAFMRGNQVVFRDRASIMRYQKAPEDEITEATKPVEEGGLGSDMNDDEISQAMQKSGSEIIVPKTIKKYEGPNLKWVFPGDFHIEPGCTSLNDSSFAIEQYSETDLWLQKMAKLTYKGENGAETLAFDKKAIQELIDADPGQEQPDSKINDLKQMMRAALAQTTPRPMEKRLLPNKKFDILEYHAPGDDGRMWITWCSDKYRDKPLGKMPYPWDLYGKFTYNELVPLPDMISAIGDSTPRLLKYVYLLKNLTVGQNFDYITQLLRPLILRETGVRIEDDVTERGLFRELVISKLGGIKVETMPGLPSGAFERTQFLTSEMGMAEPSMNNVESGTSGSPMAGKTATTAMLASKAADALTQFKIDGRDIFIRDIGEKKLWMNQQAGDSDEPWKIDQEHWGHELQAAHDNQDLHKWADDRGGRELWGLGSPNGRTTAISMNALEIQDEYRVEPVAGSYLAVDDDLRQGAAMRLQQVAQANPGIINVRKLTEFQLSTIPNLPGNPQDYIMPEQPPSPQQPEPRINISLSMSFEKLPEDVQNQILPMLGLQASEELKQRANLDAIGKVSQAADHVANLDSPAQPIDPQALTGMPSQAVQQ